MSASGSTQIQTVAWKRVILWPAFPSLLLFVVAFGLNVSLNPNLLSANGLLALASANLALVLASIGQALLLTGRVIDLSIGATISLVNVSTVAFFEAGFNTSAVILLSTLLGVCVSLVNSLLVVFIRINALLATFAMSFVAGGAALWLRAAPGGAIPPELVTWWLGKSLGMPNALAILLLVAIVTFAIRKTAFMLHLYAVGGDEAKAFASGIPVWRVRTYAYMLAGLFTGLAGLVTTLAIGSGDPLIGEGYTLQSVAAPVIGGIAILGGSGDPIGAVFGALFLVIASELLLGFGVSPFYQQFIVGIIILVGLGGVVVLQRGVAEWRRRGATLLRRRISEKIR